MFTGIVEELGTVEAIEDQGDAVRLTIRGRARPRRTPGSGDSIAVNGCCLTVAEPRRRDLDRRRHAGDARQDRPRAASRPGDRVNLERAVTADHAARRPHRAGPRRRRRRRSPRRTPSEHWEVVEVALPADAARRYLVDKGSITVDGVSLTVVERRATTASPSA